MRLRTLKQLKALDEELEERFKAEEAETLEDEVADFIQSIEDKLGTLRSSVSISNLQTMLEKWRQRFRFCIIQDVYLKIEKIYEYSPVDPAPDHTYDYRRDCFFRKGHENGTISVDEVKLRELTAVVYRQYTDASYSVMDTTPLVASDIAEPPVDRRVPGVVIYTQPNRRLRIHVYNDDDSPHSLHMHGIQYGIHSDGAYPLGVENQDGVRSDQICPGETYTYEYDVTKEMTGAWVFHDHYKHIGDNARLGVIGGLVVRDPNWTEADYEIPFFIHKVAGRRGNPLFDSGDITSGNSYNRVFNTAGKFEYICFYHPTMIGSVDVVSGAPTTVAVRIEDGLFNPNSVAVAPGGTVEWHNDGFITHTVLESGSSKSTTSYAINGRSFAGNTPVFELETGKRVRWYVFNLDLDMEWHNFHPHASHWEFGGQHLDNRSIGPAEAFVVDTVVPPVMLAPCDNRYRFLPKKRIRVAANYPIHCHVEPHAMAGMVALMRVKQTIELPVAYIDQFGSKLPLDTGTFECPSIEDVNCIDVFDGGQWKVLDVAPTFAVHGAILHTGKAMIWSGHAELGPTYGLKTTLFDPQTETYNDVPFSDNDDLFCAGHVFLPDGRLIAGGGANAGEVKSSHIFDPATESWSRLEGGQLRDFRWYPTMVTMPDGRIAIVSGNSGGAIVDDIEVLDLTKPAPPPGTDVHYWDLVQNSAKTFSGLYPGLHWLPSGDMFFSRTGWNSHTGLGNNAARFTFTAATDGVWTDFAPMNYPDRKEGASVLLIDARTNPAKAQVFVAGGRSNTDPAIPNCEIIDLTDPSTTPGWVETARMTHARIGISAVILPTGKVMIVGGRQTSGRFDTAPIFVYECEIYDPETDTWALTPAMNYPRQYHSVAMLLPDGRVFTSGGVDASLGFGAAGNQQTAEVYSPEYLHNPNRPAITAAPISTTYNANITISFTSPNSITQANLLGLGTITHHTDTSQRCIQLQVLSTTANSMDVQIPANGNIVPPGYYMLFIINDEGTPSEAHMLRIS